MKLRNLGNTGLFVSELSFGAGGYWGMKCFEEEKAKRLIDIAIGNGINIFDTGPNYSGANAEVRLGRLLKGKFNQFVVGTKVGTNYVNGKHIKDYSAKSIERSIKQSLINLQTDHIPLIHLHSLPSKLPDESMELLLRLKESGVIGHIGASVGGDNAKKVIKDKNFETLMIQYNIIERLTPAEIIDEASKRGMGIIIKSPLAQTLYSNELLKIRSFSDIWYLIRAIKNHKSKILKGMKYRFINEFPGWSGSEVALNYVLKNKNVSSAVIGTVNFRHLIDNIASIEKNLSTEIVKMIEAV